MLVASQSTSLLVRVNLSNGSQTTLASGGYNGGLAYDSSGNLFAVQNDPIGSANQYIVQLNPTTGAVIAKTSLLTGLDGLTFVLSPATCLPVRVRSMGRRAGRVL